VSVEPALRTVTAARPDLKPVLWHVERRGDFFNPLRKFVPTRNQTRTWEVLLGCLDHSAKAPFASIDRSCLGQLILGELL
jgi:hypothetical protein